MDGKVQFLAVGSGVQTDMIFFLDTVQVNLMLLPKNGAITNNVSNSFNLYLNPKLDFFLFLMDQRFVQPSLNPHTIPRTLVNIQKADYSVIIYLQVILVILYIFVGTQKMLPGNLTSEVKQKRISM